MRVIALFSLVALVACKGDPPTETETPIEQCDNEVSTNIAQVQAPDWPAGLNEVIEEYRALDGRYTAMACDAEVNVSIRTNQVIDTTVQIVTTPLEAGNTCGCTHDPNEPNDGDLTIIARTTMDVFVQNYPEAGFSEESAGNVSDMPVAIFSGANGMSLRGCATELVPPILLLDYRDTEVTFRSGDDGISGFVNLVGPDIADAGCALTNFVRVGDN